jgi:hypothetical protein
MSALVGIDARVDYSTNGTSYTAFTERNEFSINIRVDVAEHKVFVASLSAAWVTKQRTWMSWSGSLRGFYDDANDDIFDTMVAGAIIYLRFYDSIADTTRSWDGQALLTSVDHVTNVDDFSTLSVDFEGSGTLTRTAP